MASLRSRLTPVALFLAASAAATYGLIACQDTPQPLPVRTLDRSGRMDKVCMRVYDDTTHRAVDPVPAPMPRCASAATYNPEADYSTIPYHLFGTITQTLRGELAIADLTVGRTIDTDFATPGVNHVPVGALPTDVAISPDGEIAFVTTGEVNKYAVYAVPTRKMLGDAFGRGVPPSITDWPACALPEPAHAIAAIPRASARSDAGAGDAGAGDAGASATSGTAYDLVLVFRGASTDSKLAVIDASALARGAGIDKTTGPSIAPGALTACPLKIAVTLAKSDKPPPSDRGPAWYGGLPYVDGGALTTTPVPSSPFCAAGAGSATSDAGTNSDAGAEVDVSPRTRPIAGHVLRDGTWLYVADDGQSLIHVFDLSGGAPVEMEPLVLSRAREPGAAVSIIDMAISAETRDYRRYLYAVDAKDGTIIVHDVSDPRATGPRLPLTRPHPETNPLQPVDRIALGSPAASVAFARFDTGYGVSQPSALRTGALCTPSENAAEAGWLYSSNNTGDVIGRGLGPARLRGVFGFVTLQSGQLLVIDVDDWDAPCRRPDTVDGKTSSASPAQTLKAHDPYGIPKTTNTSHEVFFPVSAPHRLRTSVFMRDDATYGNRVPRVDTLITLELDHASLPTTGADAEKNPIIVPTQYEYGLINQRSGGDFTGGNVQMSFEAPDVHLAQDWAVTYEGFLPTIELSSIVANVSSKTNDATVEFAVPGSSMCSRGVEDHRLGAARAAQIIATQRSLGYPEDTGLVDTTGDYVVVTDELLDPTDPYWTDNRSCWAPTLNNAVTRADACQQTYGTSLDANPNRDFPIIEAYDDRLVVGAFDGARRVTSGDTSRMRLMRCCFHDQLHFQVRAGAEWLVTGTGSGFARHIQKAANGSCVPTCATEDSLLNGRAPAISRPSADKLTPVRDSAMAFRNAQMSFVVFNGTRSIPRRDMIFRFTSRGEFTPIALSISPSSVSVAPRGMQYIDVFNEIAIIDGQAQGLTLVDLQTLAVSRTLF